MKRIIYSAVAALTLYNYASASPQKDWIKLMKQFNMTPKYHSFCYTNKSGKVKGSNPHRKVRLASVSKLITTLWAVDELGADFQYTSTFYLRGKHLHIDADLDPVYSSRKLFFLLSQLNNLGINKLDKITFSTGLKVFTQAEGYTGNITNIKSSITARNLKDFFHTPDWNKLKVAYAKFIKETPESIIDELQIRKSIDDLDLKVKKVAFVKRNPLRGFKKAKQTYVHLSPEITQYLKFMNINSNNYIADQTFEKLGGEKGFKKYIKVFLNEKFKNYDTLRTEFSKNEPSIAIYSGSGLNTVHNGKRTDNYATCAIIVKLVEELDTKMKEQERAIQEIVAVPGRDGGTFRSRLKSRRLKQAMVAKTGTLFHTSALAGRISSKSHNTYFGMFHQLRGWKGSAKQVQNLMVSELMEELGGSKKFDYQRVVFFPAIEPMRKK